MTTKTVQEIANEFGVGNLQDGAPTDGSSPGTLVTQRALSRGEALALAKMFDAAGHDADVCLAEDDDEMAWVYVTPAVQS